MKGERKGGGARIEGVMTMEDFLGSLPQKEASVRVQTPKQEELMRLIREHGIVDGTLIWLERHPEEQEELKKLMREYLKGRK